MSFLLLYLLQSRCSQLKQKINRSEWKDRSNEKQYPSIALYHLFFFFLEENVKIPSEVILLSAICFTSLRNLCYVIDISFCRLLLQLLGPFQHIKMKLASTIYLTCKLIGIEKQFLISAKSYKDHGRERRDSVSLIHMNRVNLKNIINILLANCNRPSILVLFLTCLSVVFSQRKRKWMGSVTQ